MAVSKLFELVDGNWKEIPAANIRRNQLIRKHITACWNAGMFRK